MAGLTATGITIKSVDEIRADIEAEQLANIDPDLNVGPDDVLGQLNGIYAAALAEAWEFLEELYHSAYPDTASGQALSYIAALTGTIRRIATKAELEVVLLGTPSATIPAGLRFYPDGDPDSLFETVAPVTLAGITVAIAVTEGSYSNVAQGETLVIATPQPDVTQIFTTGTPIVPGLDEETDRELRTRREQSLALPGASTVEAIRADMLTVTGVDSCTVFENVESVTDPVLGLPPHSIEVLISSIAAPSPDPQDIVDQIWLSKPAGTQTYGGLSGTATDSTGGTHTIYYSEPVTVRLYVAVRLTQATDGTYIGDSLVAQAIEDWAVRNLTVGRSVYASDLINVVADLTGVVSVDVNNTFVEAVDATPDTVAWIASARDLGTIAAGDVTVTSV
ncbi:MAG: baseplate J/gp47 family protein [Myxococcales bacterium]|nr:baseplate J/gp47 family protein [Myxococcales bacterium]